MIDIKEKYKQFCERQNIPFSTEENISSYDDTTLFCPSGMQQFKSKFKDTNLKLETISNIQPCLRMNDLDEIGDGSHLLYFNMLGLFSFREMSMQQSIDFWMDFLKEIGIKPDYITIHPNREEWKTFYKDYKIEIKYDNDCIWSDGGDISGYCTEFYKDGIEIGNIVNPLGTCIDSGWGLERLEMVVNGYRKTKEDVLKETILKIINSGIYPSNNKEGYILKKLLRECVKNNIYIDHKFYLDELNRQKQILDKWLRLKDKFSNKSKEWWWDTHGIDIDIIDK